MIVATVFVFLSFICRFIVYIDLWSEIPDSIVFDCTEMALVLFEYSIPQLVSDSLLIKSNSFFLTSCFF